MPLLSFTSNPLWRARQSYLYIGEAQAPTLWDFDQHGYATPSNGRSVSAEENAYLSSYNNERASISASNQRMIDSLMRQALPLTNSFYNPLDSLDLFNLTDHVNWILGQENGSPFYTDTSNLRYTPWDPDTEASIRLDYLKKLLAKAGLNADTSEAQEKVQSDVTSPIAIDLDGDGIDTTSLLTEGSVIFDIDGDGNKDRTAWLSGRDAFLAIDHNGNGIIDSVNELFGGSVRGDGYAKLAGYDSNGDGLINSKDDQYSNLLLWQDKNVNGVTDPGELQSASLGGLQSISTDYITQDVYESGNLLGEVSLTVYQGRNVDAVDVYFRHRQIMEKDTITSALDNLVTAISIFSATDAGETSSVPHSLLNLGLLTTTV